MTLSIVACSIRWWIANSFGRILRVAFLAISLALLALSLSFSAGLAFLAGIIFITGLTFMPARSLCHTWRIILCRYPSVGLGHLLLLVGHSAVRLSCKFNPLKP